MPTLQLNHSHDELCFSQPTWAFSGIPVNSTMAPIIHFVRHAQAAHNAGDDTEAPVDPELTAFGDEQCAKLRASFPHHAKVRHVLASPMKRAIQTAIQALARDEAGPVKAVDILQETSDAPNDTGSDVDTLRDLFGPAAVDLSRVRDGWNEKSAGVFEPEWNKLLARSREARRLIRGLAGSGDDHVVVVSHGGMLHFLTDEWQGLSLQCPSKWSNCEYRSYEFVDSTGEDDEAALRETVESWRRRSGDERQPSAAEQREMREEVCRWIVPVLKVKTNWTGKE